MLSSRLRTRLGGNNDGKVSLDCGLNAGWYSLVGTTGRFDAD